MVRPVPRSQGYQPHHLSRRTDRGVRPVRLRQVDHDPLHQSPRRASARKDRGRGRGAQPRPQEHRAGAARSRHGVPTLQPVPAPDGAGEPDAGADLGAQDAEKGSRGGGDALPRAREDPGAGAEISRPAVRRPAAARGDRALALHEPEGHAVRRADLRARSRDDQGGAGGDDRAGALRHDHAVRHARDGLRPHRCQPRDLHGSRRDHRAEHAGRVLQSSEVRAHQAVPQPDPASLKSGRGAGTMGYFDGLTAAAFKKDSQGRDLFFIWGRLGKGRVVPTEADAIAVRSYLRNYYICVLVGIVPMLMLAGKSFEPRWFLAIGIFMVLTLAALVPLFLRTRHWAAADERLTYREAMSASAAAHGVVSLWTLIVLSALFVVAGL